MAQYTILHPPVVYNESGVNVYCGSADQWDAYYALVGGCATQSGGSGGDGPVKCLAALSHGLYRVSAERLRVSGVRENVLSQCVGELAGDVCGCCQRADAGVHVCVANGVGEGFAGGDHRGLGADVVSGGCDNGRDLDCGACSKRDGDVTKGFVATNGVDGLNVGRGKHYKSNRRKRERRKNAGFYAPVCLTANAVPVGRCETVVSQVKSTAASQVKTACSSSDAEREAKDSLARRRAAENKLHEKLAKMKLASLEDEKKCQEYEDLKRQKLIQWRNEALAKSQASLDKCKTIDPGSSSSQYEIRQQAKRCSDLEFQNEMLIKKFREHSPDVDIRDILDYSSPGTETIAMYEAEGEFLSSGMDFDRGVMGC